MAGTCLAALFGLTADQAMASYSAQVRGATLQVTGNRDSDTLALRLQAGDPNTLQLDVGADGTADFSFDRSTFTAIDVQAGGGDDHVVVDRSGGSFTDESVTLDGGAGDDVLDGGDGDDVIAAGSGDDSVDGGRGTDIAFLGTGADSFTWDPGDGNDSVEGEGGKDSLNFNGSNAPEQVDLTANGSRVRFFRNVAAVTMDLGSLERVNFRALGGADTVTVGDLSHTDLALADVDLSANGAGDGQSDTVIATGTSGVDRVAASSPVPGQALVSGLSSAVQVDGAEAGLDSVDVNTLDGADTVTSSVGVSGPAAIAVDGGAGADTARLDGSAYDDTIGIAANGAAVRTFAPGATALDTTAVETLAVSGLAGADTISGSNGIAALTHLTLDGGEGDDVLGGGDGDDDLAGGSGNDRVDGNRGADDALLGSGDDHFQWDPGDGNDSVEGQGGQDTMDFNGSNAPEVIDVFRNGTRTRLLRNVGAIDMDFDGIEAVVVNALGGVDTVTVDDLSRTGVKTADVNLSATGGGGDASPDTVVVNGTSKRDAVDVTRDDPQVLATGLAAQTRITGSEAGVDTLRVNTLGGNDDVTVAPDVNDAIATVVDLGTGE